jgi:hypothetical protein
MLPFDINSVVFHFDDFNYGRRSYGIIYTIRRVKILILRVEVINKLLFSNLHNPPPTKYFDTIINPLYSKQLLNLVLVEDCGGI